MNRAGLAALLMSGWILGCDGSRAPVQFPPKPSAATEAVLAGPLCGRGGCRCRADDESPGVAAKGRKRFEVKLGSAHELWASVGPHRFYKSHERGSACFYIDLVPGRHAVSLRAAHADAVSAALEIHESGAEGAWYDSFQFACGAPGVCDADALAEWKASTTAVAEGKHDPCGSVRISAVRWRSRQGRDREQFTDLLVDFSMKVYEFEPRFPPGSPECGDE